MSNKHNFEYVIHHGNEVDPDYDPRREERRRVQYKTGPNIRKWDEERLDEVLIHWGAAHNKLPSKVHRGNRWRG